MAVEAVLSLLLVELTQSLRLKLALLLAVEAVLKVLLYYLSMDRVLLNALTLLL